MPKYAINWRPQYYKIGCRYFCGSVLGLNKLPIDRFRTFRFKCSMAASRPREMGACFGCQIASHVQVESCNKIIWQINDSEIFASSKTKVIVSWHSRTPIISTFKYFHARWGLAGKSTWYVCRAPESISTALSPCQRHMRKSVQCWACVTFYHVMVQLTYL